MLTVLDFHVRLASPDHYSLDVFARGSSQPLARAAFEYPLSFLTEFALKELEPDFKDAAARVNRLEQFGRNLYQKLFSEDRGEYEAALQQYHRSLAIQEEIGDRAGVAESQGQMARLFTATGRYPEAFRLFVLALAAFVEMRSPNARIAASDLKALRSKWGEGPFDAAWREATGADLPDWLK